MIYNIILRLYNSLPLGIVDEYKLDNKNIDCDPT